MTDKEILSNLDDSQRKAVEYIAGPSLVIAGAGAGKTRVLTSKVAYLISQGYKPWNILTLTFTNKAAREMQERIGRLVGEDRSRYVVMGTFHSVFSRILRKESARIGYSSNYTIYDKTDSQNLIKQIVKADGLDPKVYKPNVVASRISWAKNRLILASDYANRQDLRKTDDSNGIGAVYRIYDRYQSSLKAGDCMDFDDLLVNMFRLLSSDEEVRLKYATRFRFVLVDEYQDTNLTQARILWLLTKDSQKLCVVGDDSQSIYAFRGADINNILSFTTVFPDAKLFKLERNYRSSGNIVKAAQSVIAHNSNRIPKDVYSMAGEGNKIEVFPAESDREEARIIADQIRKLTTRYKLSLGAIAILYRRNAQSRVIEEELRNRTIPYKIFGGLSFYERKEIKDVLAYFRVVVNHNDDEALRRIINFPARGIGNTTMTRITDVAYRRNMTLWEVITSVPPTEIGISAATYVKVRKFAAMIEEFSARIDTEDAYSLGKDIIEKSGLLQDIASDITDISKKENVEELFAALSDFVMAQSAAGDSEDVTLRDYLARVSLLSDMDNDTGDQDRVTLMTIHSAKGLEYEAVMIAGAEEEIIPGSQSFYNRKELEEERRLFYVALTRAKKLCYISYAHFRFAYGSMTESEPSRFIKEISESCIINHDDAIAAPSVRERRPQNLYSASNSYSGDRKLSYYKRREWSASGAGRLTVEARDDDAARELQEARTKDGVRLLKGDRVEHPRFGEGSVVAFESAGDTVKARIKFDSAGEKDLLLKFAPLQKLPQ